MPSFFGRTHDERHLGSKGLPSTSLAFLGEPFPALLARCQHCLLCIVCLPARHYACVARCAQQRRVHADNTHADATLICNGCIHSKQGGRHAHSWWIATNDDKPRAKANARVDNLAPPSGCQGNTREMETTYAGPGQSLNQSSMHPTLHNT